MSSIAPPPTLHPDTPHFEPEPPHEHEAVEWWFFQGQYHATPHQTTHFMASLFRFNVSFDRGRTENGFQLLLATLDDDLEHHATTWVDHTLSDHAASRLRSDSSPLDPTVQRAMADQIGRSGPPRPILRKAPPSRFEATQLAVEWEGFSLRQEGPGAFHLRFPDPKDGTPISLVLHPEAPRMRVACASGEIPLGKSMAYQTYPRATVEGHLPCGTAVEGTAWIDHQWGDSSWFSHHQSGTLLGWDWFGLNLDDGSDWLITRHREIGSDTPVAAHVSTRDAQGRWRSSHSLTLTPLRTWTSPRTRTRHPVAWEIAIPELEAKFRFEPLADAQEIPSFDGARSVWEGAGTVTGQVGAKAVAGRARGEFHGYGHILDLKGYLGHMGEEVDATLEAFFPREFTAADVERFVGTPRWEHEPRAYTAALSTPVWDLIDRSGKRWRPLFGILLLDAMGTPSQPFEELVCAMTELIHAGALIVDDIEDGSSLRRGGPTLHLRYGTDVALNAGNALYFLPAAALVGHPHLSPEKRLAIHEIKERVCIEAHFGQAADIHWSRTLSAGELDRRLGHGIEGQLLQMYAFKTAAASRGVAEVAAVVAGVDAETRRAAADFGLAVGVAYQIIDDIHNFSRSPDWSKTCGEDLAGGKLTYVIAAALRRLDPEDRARLSQILCDPALREAPATLDEGIDLVRASGALNSCREEAQSMLHTAWETFSSALPPTEAKIILHAMCLKLVDLAYDG